MLKLTPKNRVLFVRRVMPTLLVFFGVFSLVFISFVRTPQIAQAATANTINFQARLQTASGAIVPDGYYNVEFKLYGAQSGGTALWTEDYLVGGGHGLQTINGYLSASLGSRTAFSGINWDQQLWMTMNIGGTGGTVVATSSSTSGWDGEMNPRLPLTAVPYAFSAGQLQNTNGSNTSKLSLLAPTGGNQSFQIQDQGVAGTFNLLTQNASTGVALLGNASSLTGKLSFANSGSANTITLQSAAQSGVGGTVTIPDLAGSSDTICLQTLANCGSTMTVGSLDGGTANSNGATINAGVFYLQSASGTMPGLVNTTTQTFAGNKTFTGSTIFNPASVSATAFQIQNTGGTIFDVDTSNGRVGINNTAPAYALDVNGDINSNTAVRVGGIAVCTVSSCTPASGSGNYIQNTSGTQNGANFNIRSAASNAVTGILQGASGQTSDIFEVQSWNGTSASTLVSVSSTGTLTAGNATIQQSGAITTNGSGFDGSGNLGIGTTTPGANIDVQSGATTGNAVTIAANSLSGRSALNINSTSAGLSGNLVNINQSANVNAGNNSSDTLVNVGRTITPINNTNPSFDASTSTTANNYSISWSHTVGSNANRLLIVSFATAYHCFASPSVSYNGTSMTYYGGDSSSGDWIYYLVAPASGTHNVSVYFGTTTCKPTSAVASSWYNVNQSSPLGSLVAGTTSGSNSVTVPSTAGQPVILSNNSSGDATGGTDGSGQTQLQSIVGAGGLSSVEMSYKVATGSSTTLTYSKTASFAWGFAINAPSGAGVGLSGSVANFSSNCVTASAQCTDTSNILSLSQQYGSATGAVAKIQNAGSGDMIDFLNGSGTVVTSVSSGGNIFTTGTGTFKVTSTTALSIQNSSGTSYFNVDTSGGTITLGNSASGNYISFSATGGLTAFGTSQHTRYITLPAEYAGAVLDAAGDASCSAANNGSVTSGLDSTNYKTYYNWTSSQTTNQCYDVVVDVQLPSDFGGWAATDPLNIQAQATNTSNAAYAIAIRDVTSAAWDGNYGSGYSTPGTLGTSWGDIATSSFSGTYNAGDHILIKIRMTSKNSANFQLGTLTLTYNSKF